MPCPDWEKIETALLLTAVEACAAARHESLNRLELCQMQLLELSAELARDGKPYRERIEAISDELTALGLALGHLKVALNCRPERPRPLAFSALFDEAAAGLQRRTEELGVEIVLTGEDPTLELIPAAARAVFFQLLSNSLDAFRRAQRQGDGKIWIKVTRAAQNRCQILVLDNGPGIDATKLGLPREASLSVVSGRIFEAGVSSSDASGFGLPIAKKLLEGIGGSITLISSPAGTQFEIELPMFHGQV